MKYKSEKIAKFKMLSFCQKVIFSVSYIFIQMFNVSPLCIQGLYRQECVKFKDFFQGLLKDVPTVFND